MQQQAAWKSEGRNPKAEARKRTDSIGDAQDARSLIRISDLADTADFRAALWMLNAPPFFTVNNLVRVLPYPCEWS